MSSMKYQIAAATAVCVSALIFSDTAAQSLSQTSPAFPVTGNVPTLCSLGAVSGAGNFPLGVLINTTTGKMRTDLSAPDQTITGSWCNTPSTISITATPLVAVNATATPPAGFTRTLNYTATASGWSGATTPAVFTIGAASNPNATRSVTGPLTAPISVGVSAITPVGTDPFLVADTSYLGTVTVTIAVAAGALGPAS
jgi:hypothetical protein